MFGANDDSQSIAAAVAVCLTTARVINFLPDYRLLFARFYSRRECRFLSECLFVHVSIRRHAMAESERGRL